MTIAEVVLVVTIFAFITFGGVIAVLSMSKPAIGSFVRRHRLGLYVILVVWSAALAVVSLAGDSRVRVLTIALSLFNVLIYTSMCFLHLRESRRRDGD